MDAMTTMGMDTDEQSDVIQIVSGNFKLQKCWNEINTLKIKICLKLKGISRHLHVL